MDKADAGTEAEDINAALAGLMPQMRRVQLLGWAICVAIVVGALALMSIRTNGEQWTWPLLITGIAGMMLWAMNGWVSRRQEALVMPELARSAGLEWRGEGKAYLASLPTRLLPTGAIRKCEDLVTGRIGGREISFGEVKIETGGKHSAVQFRGIVAAFPNQVPLPAFFVAAERETRGWFVFGRRLKVDDLRLLRTISGGSGETYGVWSAWSGTGQDPALEDVLTVLTGLERSLGPEGKLYSASSDGRVTHVALSHKRDLYNIGGLLASGETLTRDIRNAHADLALPLALVQQLLTAEEKVLRATSA